MLGRRDFLKTAGLGMGALALPLRLGSPREGDFPQAEMLCRVVGMAELYSRPRPDSRLLGKRYDDEVIEVYREVVGEGLYFHNHCWFETPEGYIWAPDAQPVRNRPNPLLEQIPAEGVWTDISVPYVEGRTSPDPYASSLYRLYYSMILNVEARLTGSDGEVWYRVHDENGVIMYAPGWAFRPIEEHEVSPISPDAEDKYIVVNLTRQDLSAFENGVEVYYCTISSGTAKLSEGEIEWNTPVGEMWVWRKMISRHMVGGNMATGYDLAGVGWTTLFSADGAAIHSTYWHNYFGMPRSRGCINARPADAQWLFRWSTPLVTYHPGDLTVYWPERGTRIIVEA